MYNTHVGLMLLGLTLIGLTLIILGDAILSNLYDGCVMNDGKSKTHKKVEHFRITFGIMADILKSFS